MSHPDFSPHEGFLCCLVRPKKSRTSFHINLNKSPAAVESVVNPSNPRGETEPQNYSSVKFGLVHKRQIITMWPWASFAGARAVYLFCRAAKSNKTPSGLPSVKVLEREHRPPSSQFAGKAKNPVVSATSWNSINGTRRVVCASKY
jgi:hypothetical protein